MGSLSSLTSIINQYGIAAILSGGGGAVSGLTATGGIINDYEDSGTFYRAHIFTSSGTFDVTAPGAYGDTVEYLVVAGGGGGGAKVNSNTNGAGGGGGAGGLRTNLSGHPLDSGSYSVSVAPYPVIVGSGGAGGLGVGGPTLPTYGQGRNGGYSQFGPPGGTFVYATGGGGGGHGYDTVQVANSTHQGLPGGSGGGGGSNAGPQPGGNTLASPDGRSPTTQGFVGGAGGDGSGADGAAGGGGAGGSGTAPSPNTTGGPGGAGVQVLIAGNPSLTQPVGAPGPSGTGWFAGGGGGGGGNPSTDGVGGGPGGPYAGGGPGSPVRGTSGTYATGGGGGGASAPIDGGGGQGGSGIVVVRYQIGQLTATQKATGGAISYYNGKTIHTFTSSGTFTTLAPWTGETVEYVVIGGGGSGGCRQYLSGGGGAGSYRTGTTPIGAHPVSTSIQVGAGGVVADIGPSTTPATADGTPSYFGTPITAPGGGGGGTYSTPGEGRSGGSGGGGAGISVPGAAGTATGAPFAAGIIQASPPAGWGHPGGVGSPDAPGYGGGGGGGAGGSGVDGTSSIGGSGGLGMQLPATFRDPNSTVGAPGPVSGFTNGDTSGKFWFAGGGGGSTYPTGTSPAPGGGPGGPYAGGGAGCTGRAGGDGGVNTGGGGGGQERDPGPATQAGRGGSGIVIIAYPS